MYKATLLFDINETVLDLSLLKPTFLRVFRSELAQSLWFSSLLHASTVCSLTNVQINFRELAAFALDQLAAKLGVDVSNVEIQEILSLLGRLPPHADVIPALLALKSAGFQVVAFSNSSKKLMEAQMQSSGLHTVFERLVSVEEAGCFKPDVRAYRYAADLLKVPPEQLCLVAAHDWDTHGALSAGLKAAFVDRFGVPYHAAYLPPTINSSSLMTLLDPLIGQYS